MCVCVPEAQYLHHFSASVCGLLYCSLQDLLASMGAMTFEPELVAKDSSVAKILEMKDDVSATLFCLSVSLCICISYLCVCSVYLMDACLSVCLCSSLQRLFNLA